MPIILNTFNVVLKVTAKTDSNKQSDSIDTTVKQSHSDIELHKKEKNDSKSKEIIPQHEVPETVDKTSPTKTNNQIRIEN